MRVFKWKLPAASHFELTLPRGARLLTVQEQRGELMLWALVDPEAPTETRDFRIAGTGHLIDEDANTLRYVGTVQMSNGSLVWHVFEIVSKAHGLN